MDFDGRGGPMFGPDSSRFPAIFSTEWTFLDIPERPWMVGRVATELSL